MMPVIRIPDALYERLQKHAVPFVDTPASVIERWGDAYEKQHAKLVVEQPSTQPPDRRTRAALPQHHGSQRAERSWEVQSGDVAIPCYTREKANGEFAAVKIFGFPLKQIVPALRRAGYPYARVRRVMNKLELQKVTDKSMRTYLAGRNAGRAAHLTAEQIAALDRLVPAA